MAVQRIQSLDVFRGMTICLMIIVNTMGGGAKPFSILVHADWFGFTLADLVFPSFLFAMGNAMAFGKKLPETEFWRKTLWRTVIIFGLGFLMYWFPFVHQTAKGVWEFNAFSETRIMGVLQRIALCYALAAIAVRYLDLRQVLWLCLVLLVGYWGLLIFGAASGEAFTKAGNLGSKIDLLILSQKHIYPWDDGFEPEGILGTLPALVNVLAGFVVGKYITNQVDKQRLVKELNFFGLSLIIAALMWSVMFPISKKLWTSSFVLLTIGLDVVVMAGLIAFIDIKKQKFGVRFFEIFGQNAIVIYLFSELLISANYLIKLPDGHDPYAWFGINVCQAVLPGALGCLLAAICYMLVCWCVAFALDRKGILIKI